VAESEPSFLIDVMVADGRAAPDAVLAAGGAIVREIDLNAIEVFGWFADPAAARKASGG
jgi:hypothetical protein